MASNVGGSATNHSVIDQWLLDAMIRTPREGLANRVRWKGLSRLRRMRLRSSDPAVEYRLGDVRLQLPLSHDLPLYRRSLPHYSLNLGRIAWQVNEKYRDLTMIDVGANVGDSAAIVRMHCDIPILCIEGEERFFRYLAANAHALRGLEIECAFIGAEGDKPVGVEMERGTARVVLGPEATVGLTMRTLSEVVQRHPRFAAAKLLKIDAEGFDCKIISSESKLLSLTRPILFFEYQPVLSQRAHYDSFLVFSKLLSMGYSRQIVYEATGEYRMEVDLDNNRALEDLHHYYGTTKRGYCDLVAFHADDADVAQAVRTSELKPGQCAGQDHNHGQANETPA